MKKALSLLFILMLPLSSFAAEGIKWVSFNDGIARVKKEKKPAIVDFYADWCHWCKVMDAKTFTDSAVKKILLEQYITIRVDPDREKEKIKYDGKSFSATEFAGALGIQGFPSVVFMDKEGKLITVLPGYVDAKTLLPILGYIRTECYEQKVTLEDYLKKKGKCQ